VTEPDKQVEDCPRCGSLLPDGEEGLCPTCGYEYGRATLFMPIVRLETEEETGEAPAPSPEIESTPAPPPATGSISKKWVVIAAVAATFLLVLVLGFGLTLFLYGKLMPSHQGELGPTPPAEEATEAGE
jgi:hypothetical protein